VLAALAGLLIPTTRTSSVPVEDEPEHAELALVAAGTVVGDKPE
jgi:hypothetical protein